MCSRPTLSLITKARHCYLLLINPSQSTDFPTFLLSQLKPRQGHAMIGPGSNKRMVLSGVAVPPILFHNIKVSDETYLSDISRKKAVEGTTIAAQL